MKSLIRRYVPVGMASDNMINNVYNLLLCAESNIDFSQFEGNRVITTDEIVTLYHGSKSGMRGAIAPVSRDRCDFGKGFYMGTDRTQPLTLICNYPGAKIYILSVDLSDLKILDIEVGFRLGIFNSI